MGFRYDIQGLRALAVLLVFVFHLNSTWLTGGFVGVDVFFVISGFLVSSVILHKKNKGTFDFADFYIGRIKRIVPVFLLLLIFVGLIGSWIYLSGDIQGLRKNIFWSSVFNSNNYLAGLDNYFGASSQENPLLHTWTLSIEMQFYFLLPLFLVLINKRYIVPISLFIIILLLGYSFYNCVYLDNKGAMYFSLIARIPEFLIGSVFAIKADTIKSFIGTKQDLFSIASLVGIVLCGIFFTEFISFPGLWVILPCIFAGIILITTDSKVNRLLFSNKIVVHIGELSYSIYLWHWAIMAFIRYYNVQIDFAWYEMLLVVLITYVFSWLSYTYVENIFRVYVNKKIFIQFGGIVCVLGLIYFIMPRLNNYLSPIPEIYSKPSFGLNSHGKEFKTLDFLGDVSKRSDSILLIGDSHALICKRILDVIGKDKGFNFYAISNNVYPPFPNILREDFPDEFNYEIYKKLVSEFEKALIHTQVIIVATSWSDKASSAKKAFNDFVIEMGKNNKKVVLLNDFPVLDKNPIRVEKSYKRGVDNNKYKVSYNHISNSIKDLQKKSKAFYFVDVDYENYNLSIPFKNDTIMYYDSNHLNVFGSEVIAHVIEEEFFIKFKQVIDK